MIPKCMTTDETKYLIEAKLSISSGHSSLHEKRDMLLVKCPITINLISSFGQAIPPMTTRDPIMESHNRMQHRDNSSAD